MPWPRRRAGGARPGHRRRRTPTVLAAARTSGCRGAGSDRPFLTGDGPGRLADGLVVLEERGEQGDQGDRPAAGPTARARDRTEGTGRGPRGRITAWMARARSVAMRTADAGPHRRARPTTVRSDPVAELVRHHGEPVGFEVGAGERRVDEGHQVVETIPVLLHARAVGLGVVRRARVPEVGGRVGEHRHPLGLGVGLDVDVDVLPEQTAPLGEGHTASEQELAPVELVRDHRQHAVDAALRGRVVDVAVDERSPPPLSGSAFFDSSGLTTSAPVCSA